MRTLSGVPKTDVERVMTHYGIDAATAGQALSLVPASALVPRRGAGLARAGLTTGQNNGVKIPGWLLGSMIAFGFGVILGPAIFASTSAGAERLAELARRRIG